MGLWQRRPYLSALHRLTSMDGADHLVLRLENGTCWAIVVCNHFGDAIAVVEREDIGGDLRRDVALLQLSVEAGDREWWPTEGASDGRVT